MGLSARHVENIAPAAAGGPPVADARNRDKILMLGATVARMGLNLLTFVLLARYLGPQPFGVIATALSYATLVSLVSDFGFAVSTLRAASGAPERAGVFVREALTVKAAIMAALTVPASVVAIIWVPLAWLPIYALALVGAGAYSAAELSLVTVRAARRFDLEAKLVVVGSGLMLAILGGVVWLTRDLTAAAIAVAGTRLLYLLVNLIAVRKLLFKGSGEGGLGTRMAMRARQSLSYAVDSVLTNLSSQIDVLVFGALLSAHAIGIYQSGARLVQAILPFAVVLSTVYLPTLSAAAAAGDRGAFARNARRLNREFAALALVGGLGFAFVGPLATGLVYGPAYAELDPLWGGFGAFATVRLVSASYGIQLAALGKIGYRIAAQLVAIVAFGLATMLVLPRYGVAATSWLLAVSSMPAQLVLAYALWRSNFGVAALMVTLVVPASAIAVIASF